MALIFQLFPENAIIESGCLLQRIDKGCTCEMQFTNASSWRKRRFCQCIQPFSLGQSISWYRMYRNAFLFGAIFILFCWNWLTRFRSELDWIPGNRKNDMKSVFWSAALKQTDNFNDLKSIEMRQMDDLISFEIKQTDVPILMFDLDQCCVSFASLLRGKSNRRKSAKISISLMQTWEATLSLQLCVTPTLPHHTTEWKCRIFCVDPGQVHNQYLREAFLSWCRYYSHPHTQAGQMSRCARFPSIRSDLLGPKIVSADRSKH